MNLILHVLGMFKKEANPGTGLLPRGRSAHRMFDLPTPELSVKARGGLGKGLGEFIATFGLILTILGAVRYRREWVAATVGLYITAAYWLTSSTSLQSLALT